MLDLMRYDPWRSNLPTFGLRDWFFGPTFGRRYFGEDDEGLSNSLRMDLTEGDNDYRLTADVPGMTRDDVKVHIENGQLRIEGEYRSEHDENKGYYHLHERHSGCFSRSMCIPSDVDETKIDASVKDGVLTISLPKTESSRPKQIEIH